MRCLRFNSIGLFICAFFMLGAYAIATQIILIREFLVILFGNELCMGSIFAVWLISIFVGAALGGRLVTHLRDPLPFFLSFQYILVALPFLQIFLTRSLRAYLDVLPGETIAFGMTVAAVAAILFPFTFFIGFIFPFATSSYRRDTTNPSKDIGSVYIWESIGSMVGGAALTYFCIGAFPHYYIMACGGALLIVNCTLLATLMRSRLSKILFSALGLSLAVSWATITYIHGWGLIETRTTQQRWRSINPYIPLIESMDSRYQNLVIGKIEDQYSLYGNGQHISSFPDPLQSATTAHLLLTQHPDPKAVLLIGGGIEGLIAEILKHPVEVLHYVELDPAVLKAAQDYILPKDSEALNDPRVTVFTCDGRYYVKNTHTTYDLVIANTPDPSTAMLNRFYTVDFYKEVRGVLNPDGLLVARISSTENYIGPEVQRYVGSVYHSLARVFSHILVTPGDYSYFFASNDPDIATVDTAVLAQRFKERDIATDYFSEHYFPMLLAPERVQFVNNILKNNPPPYPNTDARPITYFYNLVVWDLFSQRTGKTFLKSLTSISGIWFVVPVALLLAVGLVYLCKRGKGHSYQQLRFISLVAIATTGFAGMGLELVLLFSFQNLLGYLYQYIGLIVASFMAGLAIGAATMNRATRLSLHQGLIVLLIIEIAVILYSLFLPFILSALQSFRITGSIAAASYWNVFTGIVPFLILVLFLGFLTGLEFPLVTQILIRARGKPGRVAGLVDGFDHGGASLGAALTGTVFVPLYGLYYSSFFIAGVNLVSIVFLSLVLLGTKRATKT